MAGSISLIMPEPQNDAMFELNLLQFGLAFTHRPFHWRIFPVNLRLFEYEVVNSSSGIYHGFIKEDATLLELNLPTKIKIINDLDNCFVHYEVSQTDTVNCSAVIKFLESSLYLVVIMWPIFLDLPCNSICFNHCRFMNLKMLILRSY